MPWSAVHKTVHLSVITLVAGNGYVKNLSEQQFILRVGKQQKRELSCVRTGHAHGWLSIGTVALHKMWIHNLPNWGASLNFLCLLADPYRLTKPFHPKRVQSGTCGFKWGKTCQRGIIPPTSPESRLGCWGHSVLENKDARGGWCCWVGEINTLSLKLLRESLAVADFSSCWWFQAAANKDPSFWELWGPLGPAGRQTRSPTLWVPKSWVTTSHFDVCFSVAYLTRISPGFAAELTADDSLAILNPLISVVLATHSCPRSLTQYRIQGVGISRSLEEGFTALNATTTKKHWRAWRTLKGGGVKNSSFIDLQEMHDFIIFFFFFFFFF